MAPLGAHLQELRHRLISIVAVGLVGAVFAYIAQKPIIAVLARPLGSSLIYNSPAGGFQFVMEVCLFVAAIVVVPLAVYHLVRFVEPAFSVKILRKHISVLLLLSTVLVFAGMAFGYFVMLPISLHFFHGFSGPYVHPLILASSYLSFVIGELVTFALMFQLPLLILFINWIHPLDPTQLRRWRKFVFIGALVLAVILPFTYDPISQFVMTLPIVVLYELSIFLVVMVKRHQVAEARRRLPVVSQPKLADIPLPASGLADVLQPTAHYIDVIKPLTPLSPPRVLYLAK